MGLFDDHHGKNYTCNMPKSFVANAPEPFIGNLSFHKFNMAVSGGCAAFATLSILVLMARHATHFSKPNEQSKILKICALIPIYGIVSFITIAFPNSYIYLDSWIEVFQAIALGSFFLLLCEFVSPSSQSRDVFFAGLEVPKSRLGGRKNGGRPVDGLEWYRKQWFAIFQYPIVCVGVAVATDITQAANVYCLENNNTHFAQIWLSIVSNISVSIAVTAAVKFYAALKKDLKHHKPLAKFIAFKLIIFLTFLQSIIFMILRSTKALKETSKLTYADVNFGIQTMIICVEMVPLSIFFHWAYDVGAYDLTKARPLPLSEMGGGRTSVDVNPYDTAYHGAPNVYQMKRQEQEQQLYGGGPMEQGGHGGGYYGGPLGINAWLTVPNPMEILRAISFGFSMRSESKRMNRQVAGVEPPPY